MARRILWEASASDWHPHFGPIAGLSLTEWLDRQASPPPPERSLVLATDERTGSEWLCQLLGATGRLGTPSEYLNTPWMRRFIADYPDDVAAQIDIAHRVGTTPNRCFALKLHPWSLDRLLSQQPFSRACPAPRLVYLMRHDLLGQAISLYRARQTQHYHFHIALSDAVEPVFDADAIERTLHDLSLNRARWDAYFARTGAAPLVVSYEELCADPLGVVRRIGRACGERIPRWNLSRANEIRRQADALSQAWRERFVRERGCPDRFDRPAF